MASGHHSVLGRLLAGGGLLFLSLTAFAAPLRDDVAALVDGWSLPERSLEILLRVVQREDPKVDRKALLDGLIENRVLARHAEREYGRDELLGEQRVGFPAEVRIDNELVSTLRAGLSADIPGRPERPDDFVELHIDHARVAAILDGTPIGEHRLTAVQQKAARETPLARFRFPGAGEHIITLAEIYDRQNVQGRIALHRGDRQWLEQEVRLLVSQRYLLYLARERGGLDREEIDALRRVISDRHLKRALLARLGVSVEIHQGNPALSRRAQTIDDSVVKAWYRGHRERFREVRRVDAWRILCRTRERCAEARNAILDGMSFSEAARRWSLEPPREGMEPGHLGWLERSEDPLDWLSAVAFAQPGDQPSPPIHHPGEDRWSVLLVSHRESGYHSADSRTVAHVARREIAREQLLEEFVELRKRLMDQARISRRFVR